MDLDSWLAWSDLFKAMLTPTLAVGAVAIALQQANTARNKLRLDLFERREKVYLAAKDAIARIVQSGQVTPDIEHDFQRGIMGARWLFGTDIETYLDRTLWTNIVDLMLVNSKLEYLRPADDEYQACSKARTEGMLWFLEELRALDERFSKHLTVNA